MSHYQYKKLNKIGAIPELSGISKGNIVNKEIASPAYVSGATGKGIANTNNNQQIEIPNNFSIELKHQAVLL